MEILAYMPAQKLRPAYDFCPSSRHLLRTDAQVRGELLTVPSATPNRLNHIFFRTRSKPHATGVALPTCCCHYWV